LGDILLTSALIRNIKTTFPDSIIDFVVDKQFAEIVEFNPHINNVIVYDKKFSIKENNLSKENLANDYKIIDLQNNFRSKIFRKGLGNEIAVFKKNRIKKLLLVWFKIDLFKKNNFSIPEKYITVAEKFGIKFDKIETKIKGLEIWLDEEKELNYYPPTTKITDKNPKQKYFFAIAPSAKHKTKQWLPEYFVELILLLNKKFDAKFYLLGGKDDAKICNFIMEKVFSETVKKPEDIFNSEIKVVNDKIISIKKPIEIINNSGKTSILETVKLIDKYDLLITNDTGIMHIGAARKLPIVAIFGSTVPSFGFAPYGTKYEICETKLKCRPCTHFGKSECPKKHFNCMKLLKPETVFLKIEKILGEI